MSEETKDGIEEQIDKTIGSYEQLRLAQLAEIRDVIQHRKAAEQAWLADAEKLATHRAAIEREAELRFSQEERRLELLAEAIHAEERQAQAMERIADALEQKP